MNTRSIIGGIALLWLFAAQLAYADNLDVLMERSGINGQIGQISEHIDAGLQQGGDSLPADALQTLGDIMRQQFAADKLKQSIRAQLQQNLSDKDIRAVLAWLETPLGKKITAQEIAASSVQAHQDVQDTIDKLLSDSDRFALIRQLDAATGASQATLAMTLNMQKAMMYGMMSAAPGSVSEQQVQQMIQAIEPQLRSQMELMVVASMTYTYRELSDDEINQYIAFASSQAGKNYHQAFTEALSAAMAEAGDAVGREIVKLTDNNG